MIRIGINGMGRIGRTLLNQLSHHPELELTAINNPGDHDSYAHLIKYDSVHGTHPHEVKMSGEKLIVGDKEIHFFSLRDPSEIDWNTHGVDIVIDATGVFKDKESLSKHLGGSVKKVILCAPGDVDGTFVMGVNHESYDSNKHTIVSNGSCTTNCLAPIAKILNEEFSIQNGFMTTIHAYTNDQNILDNSHKDMRRARAGALNMIPTSTGAAKALGLVLPELAGKLDGFAVRVPTPNVSMVDLTINVEKEVSVEAVNSVLAKASEGNLKGILGISKAPLVSTDFNGRRESSVQDTGMTNVIGKTVKVLSWYDNETGFSNRVLDLAKYIGSQF